MNSSIATSDVHVGLTFMKVDHHNIEALIDELQAAVALGQENRRGIRILRKLSQCTQSHFALEEVIMAATAYPHLDAHRAGHQHLQRQLEDFISLYRRGGVSIDQNSVSFLFIWFANHSCETDAHFADWLVVRDTRIRQSQSLLFTVPEPDLPA